MLANLNPKPQIKKIPLFSEQQVLAEMYQALDRSLARTFNKGLPKWLPTEMYGVANRAIFGYRFNQKYTTYVIGIIKLLVEQGRLVYREDGPGQQTIIAPDILLIDILNGKTIETDCKTMTILVIYLCACLWYLLLLSKYRGAIPDDLMRRSEDPEDQDFYFGIDMIKYPGQKLYSHVLARFNFGEHVCKADIAYMARVLQDGYFKDTPAKEINSTPYRCFVTTNNGLPIFDICNLKPFI